MQVAFRASSCLATRSPSLIHSILLHRIDQSYGYILISAFIHHLHVEWQHYSDTVAHSETAKKTSYRSNEGAPRPHVCETLLDGVEQNRVFECSGYALLVV